jgi:hypothetical protein
MMKWMALAAASLLIIGLVAFPRLGREPAAEAQPAGTWLFHGHAGPHLIAGMVGRYVVQDAAAAAPTATGGLN